MLSAAKKVKEQDMQLGMVGLGRMGREHDAPPECAADIKLVVADRSADMVKQLSGEGAGESSSLPDLIAKLKAAAEAVWVMIPAGRTY